MNWAELIPDITDAFDKVFDVVSKAVTDKDKALQRTQEIIEDIIGKGRESWLARNAFSIAMLTNFFMVVTLELLGQSIPHWALVIVLAWLAGPLLNSLNKQTFQKLFQIIETYNKQKGNKNE